MTPFSASALAALFSTRKRRVLAAVLVIALAFPAMAIASHNFADVPDENPFHTNIARLYGARVTDGCGGGNYCPSANVTREQMAAFMTRSGARGAASGSWSSSQLIDSLGEVVRTLTIKAGDITGGTASVLVTGTVEAYTFSAASCPCQAFMYLEDQDGNITDSSAGYIQIDQVSINGYGVTSASMTTLVTVPTGVTQTYKLIVDDDPGGTGNLTVYGKLTAVVIPFASDGSNPAITLGGSSQGTSGAPGAK